MQTWYLGSQAGHAIADVISGDSNPSGKLPFSFPVKLEDNSAHYFGETSYPGVDYNQEYKDDILVGYRWHDTKQIKPQFAFGHGLSYSTFEIENVQATLENDELMIRCKVNNTGEKDGFEVVQVYVGKPDSKVPRALKELKGFQKVFVRQGQSQEVSIAVNQNDLAYYDESIADWNLEKGTYTIYVGNASDNIVKTHKIKIE